MDAVDARDRPEADHLVVLNDEEQYSIWPVGRELPAGWREAGFRGPEPECLDHIAEVWTDMRPLSVRRGSDDGTSHDGSAAGRR
jgi:MbtH protein